MTAPIPRRIHQTWRSGVRERGDAAAFDADGFVQSHAVLGRRWRRRASEVTWNEGLYVKAELWRPRRRAIARLFGLRPGGC